MQERETRTENDQCLELVDHQSAAQQLQDVLSLRLSFFYRCAFRLLGNAADVEDAVQEALLAAYKHINQFKGQSQISTWFTTIVRNCALMQLRKRQRQIHFLLDKEFGEEQTRFLWEGLADERPSPEDELRNFELTSRLRKCTALLSPTLRRTYQLRVVEGLSIVETARILGVPHGTVKAQLARARAKIARHMSYNYRTILLVEKLGFRKKIHSIGGLGASPVSVSKAPFVVLGSCSHGPLRDENISGKFEPSAQFPHLFYGEIALPRQEHRNRTLRTKLRNEVTLREILLFNEKPHN
jgi:RNA polymerase sigma-70 factor (ECF subfamily)